MAGRTSRTAKKPPTIPNAEKLKDPKYALALHVARKRRERQGPPAPMR
jgi:hypothetical protein